MTDRLTSPRRRRWFTVSIRLMMGLVLLTAVGLSWASQRVRAQREAVAEIRRLHGIFNYDWRVSKGPNTRGMTPPGPEWLRKIIGNELFQNVNGVILARQQTRDQTANDASLEYLGRLNRLKELHLDGAAVTDAGLAHLRRLTSLEKLSLTDTKITDAGLAHLRGLTALKELYLARTKVTDAGMSHLVGLTGLQLLLLNETAVTEAGREDLLRALPKLTFAVSRRPAPPARTRTKSASDRQTPAATTGQSPPGRKGTETSRRMQPPLVP